MILDRVRTLPQADAILARIDPAILSEVDGSVGARWMPIEQVWPINDAIREELDDDAYRAFFREHTLAAIDAPVFGSFVRALLNLFDAKPGGLVKHLGRAWGMAMRGCGDIESRVIEPGRAEFIMRGLPDEMVRNMGYMVSTEGSLSVLFVLTKTEGRIIPDPSRRNEGILRFEIEWTVPGGAD